MEIKSLKSYLTCGFALLLLQSCQFNSISLEPIITYDPPQRLIESLPSPFDSFTPEERRQDWAKELLIANIFATELDFYRAITAFKRAKILIPIKKYPHRLQQIEYGIIQCYFLGGKYPETIEEFEKGTLKENLLSFSASEDLLIILYEAYQAVGQLPKAEEALELLKNKNAEKAKKLELSQSILKADLESLSSKFQDVECCFNTQEFLNSFSINSKSVRKAQTLNAILPGAGYLYVGQRQTALTSFIINTLFIGAAYHFFHHKNFAAGIITSSLEAGWYFGGINGAGIAAKEHNERLYESGAREFLIQNKLFPILMLQFSF